MTWVIGLDIGGSGSRATIADGADGEPRPALVGERVGIAASGSTMVTVAGNLLRRVAHEWPREAAHPAAIAVGATGLAALVADPYAAVAALSALNPGVPVTLATDAVTTHLGALGGRGGAIVTVGTGAIALGTDFRETWHRVDGWGHLIGDRGAGAWIGLEGLRRAALAYDGIDTEAGALLREARNLFGEPPTWPAQLYTRDDRAGVLASFAPSVTALASAGDTHAITILSRAGQHVARTLAAALVPGLPPLASTSGGVFTVGGMFVDAFRTELARLRPDVELREPAGSSLSGAIRLARLMGTPDALPARDQHVWVSEKRRR